MKTVGLVTVLYKSDEVLKGFFRSLSLQSFKDYHLYLIDNSPSENTKVLLNLLLEEFPISSFSHIQNKSNNGIAAGNNQGIKLSQADKCKYTLLLNNDIEFEDGNLLNKLVTYAESKNESIIVPKIFFFDTKKLWMAGGRMIKRHVVTDHIGYNKHDAPIYNNIEYIDYAPTCFMLINNDVFRKVGLMDETYFAYYDDSDFVIRATKAGYKILYFPNLEILHKVSNSTGGGNSPFSIFYSNRNRIIFWRKHYNKLSKITSFPFLFYSFMYQLYKCKRTNWKVFIKGIIAGFGTRLG